MLSWDQMPLEEKELLLKAEIHKVLTEFPSFWVERGLLKARTGISENGKPATLYDITPKAIDSLSRIIEKRLKLATYKNLLEQNIDVDRYRNATSFKKKQTKIYDFLPQATQR